MDLLGGRYDCWASGSRNSGRFFVFLGGVFSGTHQNFASSHINHHFMENLVVAKDIEVIDPNASPLSLLKILSELTVASLEGNGFGFTIRDTIDRWIGSTSWDRPRGYEEQDQHQ